MSLLDNGPEIDLSFNSSDDPESDQSRGSEKSKNKKDFLNWLELYWSDLLNGVVLLAVITGIVATLFSGGSFLPAHLRPAQDGLEVEVTPGSESAQRYVPAQIETFTLEITVNGQTVTCEIPVEVSRPELVTCGSENVLFFEGEKVTVNMIAVAVSPKPADPGPKDLMVP